VLYKPNLGLWISLPVITTDKPLNALLRRLNQPKTANHKKPAVCVLITFWWKKLQPAVFYTHSFISLDKKWQTYASSISERSFSYLFHEMDENN